MSHPGRVTTPTVLRGAAVVGDTLLPDAVVVVWDGAVQLAGEAADVLRRLPDDWRDAIEAVPQGGVLLPGLVDLHCHGAIGHDFSSSDADGIMAAAQHHLRHGTTSLLASVMSLPAGRTSQTLEVLGALVGSGPIVGVHLEGPYLSVARCGAQDPRALRDVDVRELDGWLAHSPGAVATMTIAPERRGALDAARSLAAAGAVPAMGHTDADEVTASTFLAAAAATGRPALVTHLFNGMRPLHHRDPGPVAAALAAAARGQAVVELVADGVHLDDGVVRTVFDLVGPRAVALVTDAIAATGTGDGTYRLGDQDVEVRQGVARLAVDGALAGATTRLLDVVRRLVLDVGLPLAAMVHAATATPARVLRRDGEIGALLPGHRADLVVADAGLHAVRVMHGGRWLG